MTRPHESPESSSPIVTRAVAAGLRGEFTDNYQFPPWQRMLLKVVGAFPQSVARFAISHFQSTAGLPPDCLNDFSLDDLIQDRLDDYTEIHGRFPVVTVGAALGGASTYLALALGGLFLPQTFVISLKQGSYDGDVEEYLNRSLEAARRIAAGDPRLMTIQHYDPIHDGWLTRFVNHLRFKLIDLPELYFEFIRTHVEPGGTVVYLEGGASWLRYRVGERSVFQVGGWGDISPEEFLEATPRIESYARKAGLKFSDWRLTQYPLERGPESEWGTEPGFAEALSLFCMNEGYKFVKVPLLHPNDFSKLAFSAALKLLEKEDHAPAGVSVECFSQFDSTSARLGGLLPLWLIFNTKDSARYLKEMAAKFPKDKPIFFSALSTFSMTPDLATWKDWVDAMGEREFINTGTRESHYPADARALVEWQNPLREWVGQNPQPIYSSITAAELVQLAKDLK
jgi:hypothetical protein